MTSSVGSLSNTYSYLPPATTAGVVPVSTATDPGLAQTAVQLSANADVIATLGSSGTSPLTYNAAGLFDTIAQAGSTPSTAIPVPPNGSDIQSATQQQVDQGIANTLPANPAAAGVYGSAGTLQNLPNDTSSNWASILKSNPSYAGTVIGDSFVQGIVDTLA
jgi:hypothetical protein